MSSVTRAKRQASNYVGAAQKSAARQVQPPSFEQVLIALFRGATVTPAMFSQLQAQTSNQSSSVAVNVTSSALQNYYSAKLTNYGIAVTTPMYVVTTTNDPTTSTQTIKLDALLTIPDGAVVLLPDQYPFIIDGETYRISGNTITVAGTTYNAPYIFRFTSTTKTLKFLGASSSAPGVMIGTITTLPPMFIISIPFINTALDISDPVYGALGHLNDVDSSNFRDAFAGLVGVDSINLSPNFINYNDYTPVIRLLSLSGGYDPISGVIMLDFGIYIPRTVFNPDLSDRTRAFIINAISATRMVTTTNIKDIIARNNISSSNLRVDPDAYIDILGISTTIPQSLVDQCISATPGQNITNPLVGDTINNCMYTLLGNGTNNYIVRINPGNGLITKLGTFQESRVLQIFIDATCTYLIIPSCIQIRPDYVSTLATNVGAVYIFTIATGAIATLTLTTLAVFNDFAFNPFNNILYYSSAMANSYFAVISVPVNFSSNTTPTSTRAANSNSLFNGTGNVIFTDVNNCIITDAHAIRLLNISGNYTPVIIAGQDRHGSSFPKGSWSNDGTQWYGGGGYGGPYKDAAVGTDAYFVYNIGIALDAVNNRLLVCDVYAQRIRTVDLTPGNNYAVSTLAGTTPVNYGYAVNPTLGADVLATLGQVVRVPNFTKINGSYLNSTFRSPNSCVAFNGIIYVVEYSTARQLVNGYVSDFKPCGTI